MTLSDAAVFVGYGAVVAGLWGAFGWPYAAMIGGFVLLMAGAKMQQIEAARIVTPSEAPR